MKKKLMVLLMILLTFTACGAQDDNGDLPSKVKIGIIRVPNDTTVAMSKGYFEEFFNDLGIKTEFIFFDSGVAANQAFSSGAIDIAEMGHTNGVVALANKLPVNLIWIHEVLGSNEALVVKEGSGIEKVEDLEGLKIATTFSSTSHLSLVKALESAGIADKVQLLDMETAEIVAAWERGDVQAAYSWEPGLSRLKETGSVLIDSGELAAQGSMTANIGLVHQNFSKKYPELVADYISVINQAVTLYKESPEEAIEAAAKQLEIPVEDAKGQMSGTIWLNSQQQISSDYLGTEAKPGYFHEVFMQSSIFLETQGNISRVPSMDEINEFIDTSFIEASLNR